MDGFVRILVRIARARHRHPVALTALAMFVGVIVSACASSPPTSTGSGASASGQLGTATSVLTTASGQASFPAQTSSAGQVTVAVTWQGPSSGPAFSLVMDSHSVNLDGYDLRELALLRTDQGLEVKPTGWDAPMGGHHRSGTLTFPATAPDGSPIVGPKTRTVELVILDVAGVPVRTFEWSLQTP